MKSVLKVIKKLSRRIDEEKVKLNYLVNLRDSITPELDGMPKNPSVRSKVDFLAAAIIDVENKITELKAILISCRIEFIEWLDGKIFSNEIRSVLFLRYGFLKKFSEIAAELHFSESTVYRLHRVGLLRLGITPSVSDDYEIDSIAIEF